MLYQPSDEHIRNLWKELCSLRCRLYEQIFADEDEEAFSDTMKLVAETTPRLRTLLQKQPGDTERLFVELRKKKHFKHVACPSYVSTRARVAT